MILGDRTSSHSRMDVHPHPSATLDIPDWPVRLREARSLLQSAATGGATGFPVTLDVVDTAIGWRATHER
jgi:hypothetical protein